MSRRREPINHGTIGGNRAHYRHGVPMCEPCRDAVRRSRGYRSAQKVAACGTEGGYYRHRNRGEETCRACRDAHKARQSVYMKAYRRRKRTEREQQRSARQVAA